MSRADYDFAVAYQRVQEVTAARSQTRLATALGLTQASVWDAVHRGNAIPASWLLALVEQYGISPHWIRTGEGPKILRALEEVPIEDLCAEIVRRCGLIDFAPDAMCASQMVLEGIA